MISIQQIEQDLVLAMKEKNQLAVDVLRGLKTRVQNEKVAKMKSELGEDEILALIRSEIKKRKEAAEAFLKGGNNQAAEKEQLESQILQKYLPAQMPEEEIAKIADEVIASGGFSAADFGKAMVALKSRVGANADGSILAKVLKDKLK